MTFIYLFSRKYCPENVSSLPDVTRMEPESLFRLHQDYHLSDPQTVIDFRLNANGGIDVPFVTSTVQTIAGAHPDPGYYSTW